MLVGSRGIDVNKTYGRNTPIPNRLTSPLAMNYFASSFSNLQEQNRTVSTPSWAALSFLTRYKIAS